MAKTLADELEALIGGNDDHQEVKHWLDTGFPPLNYAISGDYFGGMPSGRMVEMFGPPSSGKTAIATQVMISAQRAGGIAAFMDHERSFDVGLAKSMGLSTEPGQWIFKTPETFEQSIGIAGRVAAHVRDKGLIPEDAPIAFVFDSLAMMVPKSKFDKEASDYNMNDNTALARATSAAFPALMGLCEKHNMLALFLNQARTKIGVMYGDPTTTPGGNAPEFCASVRIKLGRSQLVDKTKEKIGQRIGAECVKNKVNRPFLKAAWDFKFNEDGTGSFDVEGSLLDHLTDKGILTQSGPRVTWTDGKSYFKSELTKKIKEEGRLEELKALLPGYVSSKEAAE
ncbi:hypothetical protein AY600_02070 [Phormidium willei BDU 130791]|nr:hypothetical protein AY600_02070 [Phormidium willei BDU 130791]